MRRQLVTPLGIQRTRLGSVLESCPGAKRGRCDRQTCKGGSGAQRGGFPHGILQLSNNPPDAEQSGRRPCCLRQTITHGETQSERQKPERTEKNVTSVLELGIPTGDHSA